MTVQRGRAIDELARLCREARDDNQQLTARLWDQDAICNERDAAVEKAEKAEAELAELRRATEPIPDTYACEKCGRRDGLDATMPGPLWAQITDGRILGPSLEVGDGKWNILCLWCMDELAAEKGVACSVTLHFNGRALYGTSDSDANAEHVRRLVERAEKAEAEVSRLRDAAAREYHELDQILGKLRAVVKEGAAERG